MGKRKDIKKVLPDTYIGINEWRIMQEMADEATLYDQTLIVNKINDDRPIRTEAFA